MAFDISETARNKIDNSLKRHVVFDDMSQLSSTRRKMFIDDLFESLDVANTTSVHSSMVSALKPTDFKEGQSHGSELFKDIANAIRIHGGTITNFHANVNRTSGEQRYLWNYQDFRISFLTIDLRPGSNILRFYVMIENTSELSDNETKVHNSDTEGVSDSNSDSDSDSSWGYSDIESIYTTIKNLHDRLNTLESQFDRSSRR
jgi:hypothetical protein